MRSNNKKHGLKSGLTRLFTASAFALLSAVPLATAQNSAEVDLIHRFNSATPQQDEQSSLAHELAAEGYNIVGMGMILGARDPAGYIAVFAKDNNDWLMLFFNSSFQNARLINQGTSFSVINYRYNARVSYEHNFTGNEAQGEAALIPVQAQRNTNSCLDEYIFGRNVLREKFASGYLMQGYDQRGDIMKLYISDQGEFLGTTVVNERQGRLTCGEFQGTAFRIATDSIPAPTANP